MKKSLKHVCLAAGLIAVVGLTACGGGGGGGGDSNSDGTTPGVSPNPDLTPDMTPGTTASAADRYAGSYAAHCSNLLDWCRDFGGAEVVRYTGHCFTDPDIYISGNGDLPFMTERISFTKTSANSLSFVSKITIYGSDDSTCSAPPLAEHTNSSPLNKITFDGQSRVAQGSAMVMMDKITMTKGPLAGLPEPTTNIHSLVYLDDRLVDGWTEKKGVYLDGKNLYYGIAARDHYFGNGETDHPLDADGYPTAVSTTLGLLKQ